MPKSAQNFILALALFGTLMAAVAVLRSLRPATRLKKAIRGNDAAEILRIIGKNPDAANARDSEFHATPLHWAVIDNRPELARLLIANGAEINTRDKHGMTPLHKAVLFGRAEMAEHLLNNGAEPDMLAPRYGRIMVSPLDLAAEAGMTEIIRILLNHGAKLDPEKPERKRVAPLHLAAGKGNYEAARMLLEAGANSNAKDMNGKTPLHWAEETGHDDVAQLLKLYGGK